MTNTAVTIQEPGIAVSGQAVVSSESAAIISMIERAARDPSVDIDKFERLMAMKERAEAAFAKKAYDSAFAKMQPHIPTINQQGKIVVRNKERPDVIQQSTPYALMADINEAVKPILGEYGFGLSHRTGTTPEGKISVTGILSHEAGHREETTMVLAHDSTGSKNAVQAVGSSITYGIRNTTRLLLNITSRAPQDMRADDDGAAAGGTEEISEEQFHEISARMTALRVNTPAFFKVLKIDGLASLPASRFDEAMRMLDAKAAKAVQA